MVLMVVIIRIYYVLVNHPTKYEAFIKTWEDYIKRDSNSENLVSEFAPITLSSYRINPDETRNPNSCYDPIFAALYDWAFYVADDGGTGMRLRSTGVCAHLR